MAIKEPAAPTVWVEVKGYNLSEVPPQYIIDFSLDRGINNAEAGPMGSYNLSIKDDTGMMLYDLIGRITSKTLTGSNTVILQYGYQDDLRKSSIFCGTVSGLDFTSSEGTFTGTLQGVLTENMDASTLMSHEPVNKSYFEKGVKIPIHEIVSKVCDENNWLKDIDNTDNKLDEIDPNLGSRSIKQFNNALSYIKYLARYAKSNQNGLVGYNAYIDYQGDKQKPMLHFKKRFSQDGVVKKNYIHYFNPKMAESGNSIQGYEPAYNLSMTTHIADSIFNKGITGVTTNNFDLFTKEFKNYTIDPKSKEAQAIVLNKMEDLLLEADPKYYKFITTNSKTEAQAKLDLLHTYSMALQNPIDVTIDVQGDTDMLLGDRVWLVIVLPDKAISMYSGNYWVEGISDRISGGEFTTTLSLKKLGFTKYDSGARANNNKKS